MNRNKIVIVDLDGTLANLSHRRGYVRTNPSNWEAFNKTIIDDKPIDQTIAIYKALQSQGHYMVIFSGRGNDYLDVSKEWLARYDITYDEIHHRNIKSQGIDPFEDGISDVLVKIRMLSDLKSRHPDKEIFCAIDDRKKVCEGVWVDQGIFLFDVGQMASDF